MKKDIRKEANESGQRFIETASEVLKRVNSNNEKVSEEAREEIVNNALEVATGKDFDGTETYMILLSTGGPATRIIGELDEHGQPTTATFQFQDWFLPWTEAQLSQEEKQTLIKYAEFFYFEF